ncbi:MAG TPA: AraC family transcriptional regulator [Polyangiaceae bacterium]|nr:AraC family transcriptional regulator [Polyangiaceae bacterium]
MDRWQGLIGFDEARTRAFELHGDWSGFVKGCGNPGFYLVERGELLVNLGREHYRVRAGDLLLLPRSTDHVLCTRRDVAVVPIEDITARARLREELFVVGEGHAGLRVRSTAFLGRQLPFGWLPPALLLRHSDGPAHLLHMTRALVDMLSRGAHTALCPLSEAVFIAALDGAVNAAHLDIDILRAMTQARADPERFTSVDSLARAAGLSRSRLSERFLLAFGEPPMRWLRRLRMEAARTELAGGGASVAQVSERFGYSSESAFRKAYRRVLREPALVRRGRPKASG